VDEELDETITVPRRPMVRPVISPLGDLEDTDVPIRLVTVSSPPPLVEPVARPAREEPSGIELTAAEDAAAQAAAAEDVSTQPFTRGEFDLPTRDLLQFFRFRIGRTVVWLDAVSYVGRRPSSPRIIYGQMPRLVRVPSPRQEVSSTHIEVRQLGASVVLTDMRSTNGSIVFPPTGEPRKLRQGESVVATPGTLVDIGDGNVIEILTPLTRPVAEGAGDPTNTEGRQ
jgi:hypothetical protein